MKAKKPVPEPDLKPKATLVSYTLKAVIPTGPYANIQPEIVVQAETLAEAHAVVMPYIDGLFKEYLNLSERARPRVSVTVREGEKESIGESESSKKALTAIETCNSLEALDLIAERITRSDRLTALEKIALNLPLGKKRARIESMQARSIGDEVIEQNDTPQEIPIVEPT